MNREPLNPTIRAVTIRISMRRGSRQTAAMFRHRLRVAYRDVTAGNHVYHSRYLDWLEVARNEAFREMGCPLLILQEKGIILPVVESRMRHLGFAHYDDEVEIQTTVSRLGGASLELEYRVLRGEEVLLEASTRHAVTDLAEKPTRMPAELKQALSRHLTPSENA